MRLALMKRLLIGKETEDIFDIKNGLVLEAVKVLKTAEYIGFTDHKQNSQIKGTHIFKVKAMGEDLYFLVRDYYEKGRNMRFYSISDKEKLLRDFK